MDSMNTAKQQQNNSGDTGGKIMSTYKTIEISEGAYQVETTIDEHGSKQTVIWPDGTVETVETTVKDEETP